MNRQRLTLAILVGILIVALAYAFWATPRQQRVAAPSSTPRPVSAQGEAPAEAGHVRLELLKPEKRDFPGFRRDIFHYPAPPAPKPPPRPVSAPLPPPAPKPPAIPEPAPEPEIPVAVRRELARFTFLGYLEKEGVKTIFLSAAGEIFVVKKGDRFGQDGEFHVTGLSPELLTIRQGDDPRSINIPLVEQAPLAPAALAPQP